MLKKPVFPLKAVIIVCVVYTICLLIVLKVISKYNTPKPQPQPVQKEAVK